MQQPLVPPTETTTEAPATSIKEQFSEGPAQEHQAKVPTQEEIEAYKDNMMKMYKKELPFMRLKQEYEDLMMKQLIRDVETGVRPANTVPGMLGLELVMREISVKAELGQWKASFEQAEKNKKEMGADQQESGIPATEEKKD